MTRTARATEPRTASAVVWNTVVPALGVALILGASLLPALAIAAAATAAIVAAV